MSDEKINVKSRISFFIEIEADNEALYKEAEEDIKTHFKNSRTSSFNVSDGKSYSWKIVKQRKDDVTIKKVKDNEKN